MTLALLFSACAATAPPPAPPPAPVPAPPQVVHDGAVRQPLMPAALDLNLVPVGSWAEYAWGLHSVGRLDHAHLERVAVVARGSEGITIEVSDQGSLDGERFVQAATYAEGGAFRGESRRSVFQMGDDEPMESVPRLARRYARVDPSKLVGTETVSVPAGTFTARHYRDRTGFGEQVDLWIADAVMPFGLVRLEAEQKQNALVGDRFSVELVKSGGDAVPLITKRARPFDVEYLKRKGDASAGKR